MDAFFRHFARQEIRGDVPRLKGARGVIRTPFGPVHYYQALSERSFTGEPVYLLYAVKDDYGLKQKDAGIPKDYAKLIDHLTDASATMVLSALYDDLIKAGRTTKSREQWLKDHPIDYGPDGLAVGSEDWGPYERAAAAMFHGLTTYPEEQRTHGGKKQRGGLHQVAAAPKGSVAQAKQKAFSGEWPAVPHAAAKPKKEKVKGKGKGKGKGKAKGTGHRDGEHGPYAGPGRRSRRRACARKEEVHRVRACGDVRLVRCRRLR